jgi:hypothetical protein
MKYILLLGFLLITVTSKAQYNFIGKNEDTIKMALTKRGDFRFIAKESTTQGAFFLKFENITENYELVFYLDSANNATYMVNADLAVNIPRWIIKLNKQNTRLDKNSWITKDYKYSVSLDYTEGEKYFFLTTVKL